MLPKDKLRPNRINRLLIFPDDQHPYAQNIAKFYEDPDLMEMTAKQWAKLSGEELHRMHEETQLARIRQLMSEHEQK